MKASSKQRCSPLLASTLWPRRCNNDERYCVICSFSHWLLMVIILPSPGPVAIITLSLLACSEWLYCLLGYAFFIICSLKLWQRHMYLDHYPSLPQTFFSVTATTVRKNGGNCQGRLSVMVTVRDRLTGKVDLP